MKKYFIISLTMFVLASAIGVMAHLTAQPVVIAEASAYHGSIPTHGITVTGTGTIKVQPDFASISLNVETKSKNLEEAQRENAKIVEKLVKALKVQKIGKDDITTGWFSIYPDYGYYPHHDYNSLQQRPPTHTVSNQLNVKVRDIASVGKIIDLCTVVGASSISSVQFGIEDNSNAYSEALKKAVDSAKQKATLLSAAAGLGDIKIISVKEVSFPYNGFMRYDYASVCSIRAGQTSIMHSNIEVTAMVEAVFSF